MKREHVFAYFLRFLRPHLGRFLLVLAAALLSALLSLAYPLILKTAVDSWSQGTPLGPLVRLVALLAAATVVATIISFSSQYAFVRLTQRVLGEVRVDLLHHLVHKRVGFFSSEREGRVTSVFVNDINTINEMLTGGVLSFILSVVSLCATLGLMLFLEWRLTLGLTVFMIAFTAIYATSGPAIRRLSSTYHERLASVSESLHEAYAGIRVIKSFNLESFIRNRFASAVDESIHAFEDLSRRGLLVTESSGLVTGLGLIVGLGLAGVLVSNDKMTTGSAVAYLTLLSNSFGPLRGLVGANVRYRTALGAAERVVELLEAFEQTPAFDNEAECLPEIAGADPVIEFRAVNFSYGPRSVLSNATFAIHSGERVIVRGASGAGKSTILDLMLRLHEPVSGEILFGGHDVVHLDPRWVRSQVSVVHQDPFLFNVSLRENLVLANPAVSEIDIRSTIEAVGLGALVERLPGGLDAPVGERGAMLSGGEKQRVSIARAVLRRGRLVVFDEATAWLDSVTERELWDKISGALGDRAVVLVTHDEASSFPASRTLHVRSGCVAEG